MLSNYTPVDLVTDLRSKVLEPDVDLSVIIPAWNEGWCISESLSVIANVLERVQSIELLIVDDGSTDDTVAQVQRWIKGHPCTKSNLIRLPNNRGKGQAIAEGGRRARGRFVAYIDADLEIPAIELAHLYQWARRYPQDIIVGSKRQHSAYCGATFFRSVVSWSFSIIIRYLFHLSVTDTQTGIKIFPQPALKQAIEKMTIKGYLFDIELLMLAQRLSGASIHEVPVEYRPRRPVSRIGLRHLWASTKEVLYLYRRYYITSNRSHEATYAHFDA